MVYYFCNMIQHRIAQFIERESLFSLKNRILVALSGGADSVALLRILLSLGYTCEAAHCNFQLRGEESDRDEAFVRQLCRELSVPLHVIHFDTKDYAAQRHISIEMAARELRYEWFEEVLNSCKAFAVAVAHHKDDSIETMLLNLIRGTGINGLTGISPENDNVIRPMLCVTRDEVIAYLKQIGQEYMTDSTNLQDEFIRNKIRLKLIPLMQEINPSVKESLAATARHLDQASVIYNEIISTGYLRVFTPGKGIEIDALLDEICPESLLFEILYPLGFTPSQIEDITGAIHSEPGKQFFSKEWRLVKDRAWFLLKRLDEKNSRPNFWLVKEECEYTPDTAIPRSKNTACFDADKLCGKITLRKCQTGDKFVPFGMKGKKLLSDYMTDRKFSILQKEEQWVLCCDDKIIWLVGERTDNRFRIDENTKRIVIFRMQDLSEMSSRFPAVSDGGN